MARVLIVEDEPDIALALQVLLRRSNHEVTHVHDGAAALRAAHETRPHLIILDIGLPVMDGWEVLDRLRDITDIPVLLLTAAGRDEDKVRGLRSGADDYLTKPFSNPELLARVEALLRRAGEMDWDAEDISYRSIVASVSSHTVTVDGTYVSVTPQEFRLLLMFLRNRGQVLSTAQLLAHVWGDTSGSGGDRVKFAVLRLRRKLQWDEPTTTPLVAVRGVGYRLEADPTA
ncbi:MAG: response regulator transcription factor [Beutenbergiaceae bacterium]